MPYGLCEVCRSACQRAPAPADGEAAARGGLGNLCADCRARFAAPRPRCRRCALPVGAGVAQCGECLRTPPPFEHAVCAVDYGFPWSRIVADLKYRDRPERAGLLAALLADAARAALRSTPALPRPDALLPVPLSPERLAERGANQAWEIARRVARALRLPARHDLLLRPLDTPHQAELTRAERLANLRAAFCVDARLRPELAGRRFALVDDVLTTGATARAAAAELLRGGAAAVDVWVFARTA